jgi:hypothetical protein
VLHKEGFYLISHRDSPPLIPSETQGLFLPLSPLVLIYYRYRHAWDPPIGPHSLKILDSIERYDLVASQVDGALFDSKTTDSQKN